MKNIYLLFTFLIGGGVAFAQNPKSNVFIIGNNPAAVAAAKQSALSGAYTELLIQDAEIHPSALNLGLDSLKNLTIHRQLRWQKLQRSGNSFTLKLSDGKTKKAKVLLLVGETAALAALKISPDSLAPKPLEINYNQPKYRTSIAATAQIQGQNPPAAYFYSFYDLIIPGQENLLFLSENAPEVLGQGAGAMAAYACFFGKKLSEGNLKVIQGELFAYQSALMPLADLRPNDPNWRAIQAITLMGVFKANKTALGWSFNPDSVVTAKEIREIYKELYAKSHIWFEDLGESPFTLEKAIELIAYVGQKTTKQITETLQKNWDKVYQIKQPMDLNKALSRREFSIIAQQFMPPFNVAVDKNGKILK